MELSGDFDFTKKQKSFLFFFNPPLLVDILFANVRGDFGDDDDDD
jgi:hypothetical protein